MRVPGLFRSSALRTPLASVVARASRRPGYDTSEADTVRRVRPMLAVEPVVWLSTVRPNGLPHIVPTWFWWDGRVLHVFSKPNAVKVRNLLANPRLMVALGQPEDDFAVALIEAKAAVQPGPAVIPDAFFHKYGVALESAGMDSDAFRATYTQAITIVPTRFLPWHGRGARHDVAARDQSTAPLGWTASQLPAWA